MLERSSDNPGTFDRVPHWTRQQIFSQNLHSRYSVPMKYHQSMSNTLRTVCINLIVLGTAEKNDT